MSIKQLTSAQKSSLNPGTNNFNDSGTQSAASNKVNRSNVPARSSKLRHKSSIHRPSSFIAKNLLNQCIMTVSPKKSGDVNGNLTSLLYFNIPNGPIHRLKFTATDVHLTPVYVYPRKSLPKANEKETQIYSQTLAYESYRVGNASQSLLRTKYEIDKKLDVPLNPTNLTRVYSESQLLHKPSISKRMRTSTAGYIIIKHDGIVMRIRSDVLQICKQTAAGTKTDTDKLGVPPRRNQAQILVRYKNDVLNISFKLSDCCFTRHPQKVSTPVQTDLNFVLIKEISKVNNRLIFGVVPESTYIYNDPMTPIKRLNNFFMGTHIMPLWKYKLFRKRIIETKGLPGVEKYVEEAVTQSQGSVFIFDGFDTVLRANTGLLCCNIVVGEDIYEENMRTYSEILQIAHSQSDISCKLFDTEKISEDISQSDHLNLIKNEL